MTSLSVLPTTEARPGPELAPARGPLLPAALLGLLGILVSAFGSWQPSYWGDEAASVMSAERSLPSLFRMLGNVDAVHGTYYLILHFWIEAFGASEFSTRLPSAIAIGVAAAGIYLLARRLTGTTVATVSALVFVVLPRVTYMGAEARSTAMATAIAVWLTVLLVRIVRSEATGRLARVGLWSGYAALLAAGIYMFLYVVLLVPVLALTVFLLSRPGAHRRRVLRDWAIASSAGLLLALPVMLAGVNQREQIAFIGRRPEKSVLDAAVQQWFGNVPLAIVAWVLIGAAIAITYLLRGRLAGAPATRKLLAIALAWMLFPSAVLLFGTHFVTPMYSLRYLSICTPAAAIAVGIGVAWLKPRWAQISIVVLIVSLMLPTYQAQRGDYGKNGGSDWRQAADIVRAGAQPGDAIVFDESVRPSRKPRLAIHLYPSAFLGMRDVTLDRAYDTTGSLWDVTTPLASVGDRLTGTTTVWVLQYKGSKEFTSGSDIRTLQQLGFTVTGSTTVNRTIIIELTR
ncbi:glycosyltransferase family 39 protein [Cryobacterium sp. PH31-AA6]|uniref:glycosyltransferase family 39 protein n=1 Tax=Cryobacterium sp. PH31-AA6 TaxID=3046205 RepID=UPI0024B9A033|nr:glycosyltransferase family 39 protein [Cryobacterium sp. PH31-AA6]MDJ0323098.1 glycosyltransferase family 39 protein [Cryobacterium sp. PH31-AA6]